LLHNATLVTIISRKNKTEKKIIDKTIFCGKPGPLPEILAENIKKFIHFLTEGLLSKRSQVMLDVFHVKNSTYQK